MKPQRLKMSESINVQVAVVTGSNKGIGLAIVRGLCLQFKGDVYLTSRDEQRGKAAVEQLESAPSTTNWTSPTLGPYSA